MKIGVYICHCGTNIAGVIDVEELRKYAETLPGVSIAKTYTYMCSEPGQRLIKEDIEEKRVNRVVIAACSPLLHEITFRRVLKEAGLNPYLLEIANIREHNSWVHMEEPEKALEKAKDAVRIAVAKVSLLKPVEPEIIEVGKNVLVIGGGIAGITASLDLADAGFKVYLVEKTPSIGGHMAMLDKTFPTMDCSQCILTPKMVAVARHPNITLMTYSEVIDIDGFVGNFKVKILKKPRYVDENKCTACGECAKVCPVQVPDEFNAGLGWRKAIYIPFPQAVPNTYVLDDENCLGLTPMACGECLKACDAKAINLDARPEIIELDIDTIIVATGFEPYDPTQDEQYGYGVYQDVITALEMERMLNAAGPTGGKVVRPSNLEIPKKIAYVQCVGSRDMRRNKYCSRICCMYAMKQATQLKEKYPDIEVYIFYIDIRAFGKGYEEFYWRAQEKGIFFIRGKVSEIWRDKKEGKLVVRVEDTLTGRVIEEKFDMVVLSIGMTPGADTEKIRKLLKIPVGPDGFFLEAHPKLRPVDTIVDGIFICGTATGPKDIVDTVAQAKAAASSAAALMSAGRTIIEPYFAIVDERLCSGCGTCISVCPFNAIKLVEWTAKVNKALCKGCGACAASCPSNAITVENFSDEQIIAQIRQVRVH